jgi:hypothetical protein
MSVKLKQYLLQEVLSGRDDRKTDLLLKTNNKHKNYWYKA